MYSVVLVCLLAQSITYASCETCELCPKGRVYPLVVDCGLSEATLTSKFSHLAHDAYNLLASTEVAATGLLSAGAAKLWSALFGRKRNVQILNHCDNIYNYPSTVLVINNGTTYIKIHYHSECALVPQNSMFCPDQCCNKQETTAAVQSVTTQKTIPSTTTQLHLTGLKMCNKSDVVTKLAHSQTVSINGLMCRDGTHGLSETVLIRFCNATSSFYWQRGYKVLEHCNSIPPFTAIAAFSESVVGYSHESVSGVFLSCTDTEIQIATEDCAKDFSVLHIKKQLSENFYDNAENYYTIRW